MRVVHAILLNNAGAGRVVHVGRNRNFGAFIFCASPRSLRLHGHVWRCSCTLLLIVCSVHSVSNERRVCTQWRRCMFRELCELCCECLGCCCVLYVVTRWLLFIAFKSSVLVQLVTDLADGHADFVDGLDYRGWRHPSTHARSACGIVRTMFGFALIVSVLLAVECHEACPNTDPFPIRVLCAWVLTCPFELHNGYTCFEYVSGTGDLERNMFSSNGKASLQLARKSERCRNSDVPRMCPMQMNNECRDACSVRLLPEHKRWLASRPKICFRALTNPRQRSGGWRYAAACRHERHFFAGMPELRKGKHPVRLSKGSESTKTICTWQEEGHVFF